MTTRTTLALAGAAAGLLIIIGACAGPIPLSQAIWPQHDKEYRQMLAADPQNPQAAWYAWTAAHEGISVDEARARDQELSTTHNPYRANRDGAAVSRGAVIYRAMCQRCHGADARGDGGDLLPGHAPRDMHAFGSRFAATIHGGAPRAWFRKINAGFGDVVQYPDGSSTAMPAFGDTLARAQIWQVITYLQSLDMYRKTPPASNNQPS